MKLFGTDGIRGRVNSFPMTPEIVLKTGMAIAETLKNSGLHNMVLIGKDTRLSGYLFESALTAGICSMGMNVALVGPLPTPAIAFLTRSLRLDAGIVISASHNPFQDNGIKVFSLEGLKLSDDKEKEIEDLVFNPDFPSKRPFNSQLGKAFRIEDAVGRYIEYVKSTIPRGFSLDGLKVVVDTANGSAYKVTPTLLKELGANVISINDNPDGTNINNKCGSTHMVCVREAVMKSGADIGIAHDGDADRTLFIDDNGNIIDGDLTLSMWAIELKAMGKLKGDAIVATVMTNSGIEEYLEGHGIKLIRAKVGDRYVVEEMLKGNYNLGGEQSGHIIFFDYNTTGDGPITALQVLYLMKKTNKSLSKLAEGIMLYPQVLINVPVKEKQDIQQFPEIIREIEKGYKDLNNKGRILIRPSGTESKIRVMVEAYEYMKAKSIAERIAKAVDKKMG